MVILWIDSFVYKLIENILEKYYADILHGIEYYKNYLLKFNSELIYCFQFLNLPLLEVIIKNWLNKKVANC